MFSELVTTDGSFVNGSHIPPAFYSRLINEFATKAAKLEHKKCLFILHLTFSKLQQKHFNSSQVNSDLLSHTWHQNVSF